MNFTIRLAWLSLYIKWYLFLALGKFKVVVWCWYHFVCGFPFAIRLCPGVRILVMAIKVPSFIQPQPHFWLSSFQLPFLWFSWNLIPRSWPFLYNSSFLIAATASLTYLWNVILLLIVFAFREWIIVKE